MGHHGARWRWWGGAWGGVAASRRALEACGSRRRSSCGHHHARPPIHRKTVLALPACCLQRTKSTTTGAKLVVPKPVNLPSKKKVRRGGASGGATAERSRPLLLTTHGCCCPRPLPLQEHQGNDPTTQLVPSGTAGAGWSKPEEPQPQQQSQAQPEVRQSALTAGSNWASSEPRSGSTGWVPPAREGPFAAGSSYRGGSSFPVERHLNPEEYPSLAATASEKLPSKRHAHEHPPTQFRSQVRGSSARQQPARRATACVVAVWLFGCGWYQRSAPMWPDSALDSVTLTPAAAPPAARNNRTCAGATTSAMCRPTFGTAGATGAWRVWGSCAGAAPCAHHGQGLQHSAGSMLAHALAGARPAHPS